MSIETEQPVSLAGLRRKFGDDYMINAVNSHASSLARIAALERALEAFMAFHSGPKSVREEIQLAEAFQLARLALDPAAGKPKV